MARTPSNMVPLGSQAPLFSLLDVVSGEIVSLDNLKGEVGTLIMFICNHCPFVKHIEQGLIDLANDYSDSGINLIAISSNDVVTYPEDSPEKMKELSLTKNYPFPYLYDATQEVAKSYDAACTPDFYLYNKDLCLVYRGQMDDSRPKTDNPAPVTGRDLRAAFDCLISGKPVSEEQIPSLGCNIKWK